jgi:brefeldin A-resistance guanine nucleotide exchange factor 1
MKLASKGSEQAVTGDNFAGLVTVLDEFATAAGVVLESQQRQGRRKEQLTSSKYAFWPHLFVWAAEE